MERPEAACITCHKIRWQVAAMSGRILGGVIARHDREYILESILFPNKQIAPGFESVLLKMKDGQVFAGILKSETPDELILNSPEEGVYTLVKVKKA